MSLEFDEFDVRHLQPMDLSGTDSSEISLASTNGDAHSVSCRQPTGGDSLQYSTVYHWGYQMNLLTLSTLDLMFITPFLSTAVEFALTCLIKRLFFATPTNSSALHTASKY